ncbi:glutamate receptor ionotropic, delta-2-like [Scylla paramamosain]|uniref:glutamate receptor ionotropic, delta-2-like n=1 Tax=Scylla paramamosain TaxID=85552 RepID=UPI003082A8D7
MTSRRNTTGCLKIVTNMFYPFIFLPRDGSPLKPTGSMAEVMEIILKYLNFCHEYFVPQEAHFGYKMGNGSWTGIIGTLERNEADMTGVVVGLDQERTTVADFTSYLYTDQKTIIHKRPMIEPDIAGFLKPYTTMSWVMILVALVTVAVIVLLTGRCSPLSRPSPKENTSSTELQDASFWSLATALAQSYTFLPRGRSQQAVLGMWLVLSLIISTVYRSNLKAMLIKPRLVLPFTNLRELTETNIPCFVVSGTILHRNIQAAEEGTLMWRLNRKLISHFDVNRGIDDMSKGKHAFFATYAGLLSILHSYFMKTKTCSLYMIDESFFGPTCLCIAFPKGSPLREAVNSIIKNLRESGILEHLFTKYVVHASTCLRSDPTNVDSTLRPLEIGDMYGVCLIYAGGK